MKIDKSMIPAEIIAQTKSTLERIAEIDSYGAGKSLNAGEKVDRRISDNKEMIIQLTQEIYTPIVFNVVGEIYQAVYLAPAWAPFNERAPSFAKKGEWTLIDKEDLGKGRDSRIFKETFSDYKLVKFDVSRTPHFPLGVKPNTFDLCVFSFDRAEDCSFYRAADLLLKDKRQGVLMTHPSTAETMLSMADTHYSVLFDPENSHCQYVMLLKKV